MNDVTGLNTELTDIKQKVGTNTTAISGKAPTVHTHVIADVSGLGTALSNIENELNGLDTRIVEVETALPGKAALVHTHAIAEVTGLQTALNGKANTTHAHTIADVTGLQPELSSQLDRIKNLETGKADKIHTHVITDVTGLRAELDALAANTGGGGGGLTWGGEWFSDVMYQPRTIVSFENQSSLYVRSGDAAMGVAPNAVESGWDLMMMNTGMRWSSNWLNEMTYAHNDVVIDRGLLYINISGESTPTRPAQDKDNWFPLTSAGGGESESYWYESISSKDNKTIDTRLQPDMVLMNANLAGGPGNITNASYFIAPAGSGSFSTNPNSIYPTGGYNVDLTLLGKSATTGYGSFLGGGDNTINLIGDVSDVSAGPELQQYQRAMFGSLVLGGTATMVSAPGSASLASTRIMIDGIEGESLSRTPSIVIGSEDVMLNAMRAGVSNSFGVSITGGNSAMFVDARNAQELNMQGTRNAAVYNVERVQLDYSTNVNILGLQHGKLINADNFGALNARGVRAEQNPDVTVIGGSSTFVRDTKEDSTYAKSTVIENGLGSIQTRRYNARTKDAQASNMPELELNLWSGVGLETATREINMSHVTIKTMFVRHRPPVGTLHEVMISSVRAHEVKFTVTSITASGGEPANVSVGAVTVTDLLEGRVLSDPADAVSVSAREYQNNVFVTLLFDKLHYQNGAAYGESEWTANYSIEVVEGFNLVNPNGNPFDANFSVTVPNIPRWEGDTGEPGV